MKNFYPLEVQSVKKNTPDSVIITLIVEEKHKALFTYRAGQYLTFKKVIQHEELRRSYSICASEQESVLRIGVKAVEDGAFSNFVNTQLKPGDKLDAMPPMGSFTIDHQVNTHLLFIAAGSGITPIISHIETALNNSENTEITLLYGNKTPHSTMFRERIEELKNLYMSRLNIIHILSETPSEIDLFSGRITSKKYEEVFSKWLRKIDFDQIMICGPQAMTEDLSDGLSKLGIDSSKIKYELFGTTPRKQAQTKASSHKSIEIELCVILDGTAHKLEMNSGENVLEVAKRNHLDVPYSCLGGICSTCKCKIIEGMGEMEINHALEDYEVQQGYALSCQLRPTTDKITISYDEGH